MVTCAGQSPALVIGSVLGAVIGVLVGVVSALKQHSFTDRLFTPGLLRWGALQVNEAAGETVPYYTGYETPGLEAGFWDTVKDQVAHLIPSTSGRTSSRPQTPSPTTARWRSPLSGTRTSASPSEARPPTADGGLHRIEGVAGSRCARGC